MTARMPPDFEPRSRSRRACCRARSTTLLSLRRVQHLPGPGCSPSRTFKCDRSGAPPWPPRTSALAVVGRGSIASSPSLWSILAALSSGMTRDLATSEARTSSTFGSQRRAAAHRFGGGQIEATGEHTEPVQHRTLRFVEQVVRPIDERAQGSPPPEHTAAAGQFSKSNWKLYLDLGHAEAITVPRQPARARAECLPAASPPSTSCASRSTSTKSGLCSRTRSTNRRTLIDRSSASTPCSPRGTGSGMTA